MSKIVCDVCKTENESRNYYCSYCGKQLKEFNKSKRYGERNKHFYSLPCVIDDSSEIIKDSFAPYRCRGTRTKKD